MKLSVRSFVILLVVGAICALAFGILAGRGAGSSTAQGHDSAKTLDERVVRSGGTYEFPNSVGHPGDPEEAVKDFKRIYAAMDAYRQRYGILPRGLQELTELSSSDPSSLSKDDLQNPYWQYAEDPDALAGKPQRDCVYLQRFLGNRPDGTPMPPFPKEGELDVWLYSTLAVRSGTVRYPDGSVDKQFSGVYVVLFSDGTIRKFKHKELFFVEHADLPGHTIGFPGMTGYTKKVSDFEDYLANKPWEKLRVNYED